MICKACKDRSKIWNGDDPVCGFNSGEFNKENWQCRTMGSLRELAENGKVWCEDQYCSVLPIPESCGDFIVLSWYKSRGRTDSAIVMTDEGVKPLTLEIAEETIRALQ